MGTHINRRRFIQFAGQSLFGLAAASVGGAFTGNVISQWYQNRSAAPEPPRTGVAIPPTSITTPSGIRVHHIQTGFVAVKQVHRSYAGPDGQGILAIATARQWTEWMPITAWAIEHPEGVMLIDTGDVPEASTPGYYDCDPFSALFYTSFLRFSVTPEEVIDQQLASLGIMPADVRWVVQTHLHGDHVHGLSRFPQAEVITSALDYPTSQGAVACLYPDWLNPTLVRFDAADLPGFSQAFALTAAEDMLIVPTPGHSAGHQSVILRDSERSYFFAGDTSFDEAQMLAGGTAGIALDPAQSRQTLASIRTYCAQNPTVYLPSHDHETATRLRDAQTVQVS